VAGELVADRVALLGRRVGEALEQVGPADGLREVTPETTDLEHHQHDRLPVCAHVRTDERVLRVRHVARRGQHEAVHQRRRDVRRQDPQRGAEERDVHLGALARSLAAEERGGDATRDARAADEVPEGRPLRDVGLPAPREPVGNAAAGPERNAVVAAASRIGAALPLAVAARVDESRVHPAEVLVRQAKPLARIVEEAREEHVGPGDEPIEELPARGLRQVEAEAPLVPPELLDDEVPARRARDESAGDESPDRVPEPGMLHLDHLGAPIAEHGAGRRHEAPFGHFEHADAVEDARHAPTLGRPRGD